MSQTKRTWRTLFYNMRPPWEWPLMLLYLAARAYCDWAEDHIA